MADTTTLHSPPPASAKMNGAVPATGLVVANLGKTYKGRPVLRDVSMSVQRGEAVGTDVGESDGAHLGGLF